MGNKKRRKKERCLNCNINLQPHMDFCHKCGQENHQKRATFKMLVTDFTQDYWTFDSKLFRSLKPLLFNPGFLTLEFIKGKRRNYIRPIRLYLFISFIFFLTSSLLKSKSSFEKRYSFSIENGYTVNKTKNKNDSFIPITQIKDSIKKKELEESLQEIKILEQQGENLEIFVAKKLLWNDSGGDEIIRKSLNNNIPIFLFFTIPFLAFTLFLFFYKRKRFYVDHLIFALHIMSFYFLLLLFSLLFKAFIFKFSNLIIWPIMILYSIVAIKKYYNTNYIGSFLRLLSVTFIHAIVILILFSLIYLIGMFTII